jgi:hypothetical protein
MTNVVNFIKIVMDPSVSVCDVTVNEFKTNVMAQLKMMCSSSLRLLENGKLIDENGSQTFSDLNIVDPSNVSILFESGPTFSSTQSNTNKKNKSELVDLLESKFHFKKSELKKYTVSELKNALKSGSLPEEERKERLSNQKERKPSAYIFWQNQVGRKEVKSQFPELESKNINKKCGELWKALSEQDKQKWKNDAEAAHVASLSKS